MCFYLFSFFCIHSPLLCSNTTAELYFSCTSVAGLATRMCLGSCPHTTILKTRLSFYILLLITPPHPILRHISSEWHKKKNECSKVTYHRNGLLNLNRQNGGCLVLSALFFILFCSYVFLSQ